MKVAIITDTHYGGKNDNLSFAEFQRRFYDSTFFPICEREGVTEILHLGDVFDRRKYSNFHTLKLAKCSLSLHLIIRCICLLGTTIVILKILMK